MTLHERIEAAIATNGVAVIVRDSKGRLRVASGRCIECGEETARRETPRCRAHAAQERRQPRCSKCGNRGHSTLICPLNIGPELARMDRNKRWRARHGEQENERRRDARRFDRQES